MLPYGVHRPSDLQIETGSLERSGLSFLSLIVLYEMLSPITILIDSRNQGSPTLSNCSPIRGGIVFSWFGKLIRRSFISLIRPSPVSPARRRFHFLPDEGISCFNLPTTIFHSTINGRILFSCELPLLVDSLFVKDLCRTTTSMLLPSPFLNIEFCFIKSSALPLLLYRQSLAA